MKKTYIDLYKIYISIAVLLYFSALLLAYNFQNLLLLSVVYMSLFSFWLIVNSFVIFLETWEVPLNPLFLKWWWGLGSCLLICSLLGIYIGPYLSLGLFNLVFLWIIIDVNLYKNTTLWLPDVSVRHFLYKYINNPQDLTYKKFVDFWKLNIPIRWGHKNWKLIFEFTVILLASFYTLFSSRFKAAQFFIVLFVLLETFLFQRYYFMSLYLLPAFFLEYFFSFPKIKEYFIL